MYSHKPDLATVIRMHVIVLMLDIREMGAAIVYHWLMITNQAVRDYEIGQQLWVELCIGFWEPYPRRS